MGVKIFVTGGTIDKIYDEYRGILTFATTHIPEMLRMSRCKIDVDIETIVLMDSLDMQNPHRQLISHQCKKCLEDRIVITHGTDTMVETAKVIAQERYDKTIVLTGSIIPYSFGKSDALFNLATAIAFVQVMPSGVYIAMNGFIFNYYNATKDRATNEFKTIK